MCTLDNYNARILNSLFSGINMWVFRVILHLYAGTTGFTHGLPWGGYWVLSEISKVAFILQATFYRIHKILIPHIWLLYGIKTVE